MDNSEIGEKLKELMHEVEELRGIIQGRGDIIKELLITTKQQQETIDSLLTQLAKSKI